MTKRLLTFTHAALTIAQALGAVLLVKLGLLPLALLAAIAGKWRVFSLNPYRLLRNIRANLCDITVILSSVLLMDIYRTLPIFLGVFAIFLVIWLLFIKPASSRSAIAIQAACCQFFGLTALWLQGTEQGLSGFLVIVTAAIIAYGAGRQLAMTISNFYGERSVLPIVWAVLTAELAWLSWLWSITYHIPGGLLIPQIALLTIVIGYFASYHMFAYADHKRRLPVGFIWQQLFFFFVVLLSIIGFTPWTN